MNATRVNVLIGVGSAGVVFGCAWLFGGPGGDLASVIRVIPACVAFLAAIAFFGFAWVSSKSTGDPPLRTTGPMTKAVDSFINMPGLKSVGYSRQFDATRSIVNAPDADLEGPAGA